MKKTLLKVASAVLAASALFFVGCSGITQGDFSSEAFYTLDAPKVTAVAYPGLISASWTKVADAASYDVQVFADGQETTDYYTSGDKITIPTKVNGVAYTIRVAAKSDAAANPGRAVSVSDSKYAETKATSIVPPAGTSALQLAAYETGYSGSVKTAKTVLTGSDIRVTQVKNDLYISLQDKCYLNYEIQLLDAYGVLTDSADISGTSKSIIKNDQWIETKLSVSDYGTYTLVVEVTSATDANGGVYPADVVTGSTYTYKLYSYGAGSDLTVAYVDNIADEDNAVRLTWTPAAVEGEAVPVDMYKVYYRTAYSNELVEVTKAEEKDADGNVSTAAVAPKVSYTESEASGSDATGTTYKYEGVKYYLDTTVTDPTIAYTFYVVVANGDEISSISKTLYASKTIADYTTVADNAVVGTASNTKIVNDVTTNDIVWTIKKNDKYQTFKAYALSEAYDEDGNGYTSTPIAADFDTTTDLADKATTSDNVTYKLVQEDVATGKYYLLVVFSEDGKKDKSVVSNCVTVGAAAEPSIAKATLNVTAYDASLNDTNSTTTTDIFGVTTITPVDSTYQVNKNDVVVTFTDVIDSSVETIDTYTYELYRAAYTYEKSATGNKLYETLGAFEKVDGFKMVANETPTANATASNNNLNYAAIVKQADLAAGKYIYKVVKTNAATAKYADTSKEISIAEVGALNNVITFSATEAKNVAYNSTTKAWEPVTKYVATQTNRFTVTLSNYISFTNTDTNQVRTGYVDNSTGVVLNLYKAEKVNGQLSAVYSIVGTFALNTDETTQTKETIETNVYKADGTLDTPKENKDVVTSKEYNLTDTVSTTTGVTVDYILIATKEGYKDTAITIY